VSERADLVLMSDRAEAVRSVTPLSDRARRARTALGVIALGLGLLALAHVVRAVGLSVLVRVVMGAGPLALGLALFELSMIALEALAARSLVDCTGPTTVRGAIPAYALGQVMPGWRVGGELARATLAARERGLGRATHTAIVLHGAHVACVALMLWLGALALRDEGALSALLAAGASWNLALAALFLAAPRSVRVMSLLAQRLDIAAPIDGPPAWPVRARAAALIALSRVVHVAQAALALWLVTRPADARGALAVESLQLLASTAGDAVPGQAGVLEATFHAFAPLVSPADASLAVGVALLLRAARLGLLAPLAVAYWAAGHRSTGQALVARAR